MKLNAKLRREPVSVNVSVLAVLFHRQFSKIQQFQPELSFFENCRGDTTANTKTFPEK